MDGNMQDDEETGGLKRRISQIPCFRNSMLSGIGTGIAAGLASFMFTSKVRKSTNIGFASYVGVVMLSWSWCRYQLEQKKFEEKQFKKAIQARILAEGTELETKILAQQQDV